MKHALSLSLIALLTAPAVAQDAPRVAVDVAPLHGLVARVMQGVAEPGLVLPQGASPHGYSMRPSEARLLQEADLVFHIGEGLTPWLDGPLESLAGDAQVISVMDLPGVTVREFREGMDFEDHEAHGHEGHDHDDHGEKEHGHKEHGHKEHGHDHEEHADEKHAKHDHDHDHEAKAEKHDDHGHDEHGHEGHGHEGHDHSGADPHSWMDPANAMIWTQAIADVLADNDEANAEAYRANAEAAMAEIEAMSNEIKARLAPHEEAGFVVFHDAYQYFEEAFGLHAAGAISLGDAASPGAARLAAIQGGIADEGVVCVFSEPQFSAGIVQTVIEGTDARKAVLDPMGVELELGPQFYPALMRGMADVMAGCFEGDG